MFLSINFTRIIKIVVKVEYSNQIIIWIYKVKHAAPSEGKQQKYKTSTELNVLDICSDLIQKIKKKLKTTKLWT